MAERAITPDLGACDRLVFVSVIEMPDGTLNFAAIGINGDGSRMSHHEAQHCCKMAAEAPPPYAGDKPGQVFGG